MFCDKKQKVLFHHIGAASCFFVFFSLSGLLLYFHLNVIFCVYYLIQTLSRLKHMHHLLGSMEFIQFLTRVIVVQRLIPASSWGWRWGQHSGQVGILQQGLHKRQTRTCLHAAWCLSSDDGWKLEYIVEEVQTTCRNDHGSWSHNWSCNHPQSRRI